MRAVIQLVSKASVRVNSEVVSSMEKGLVVLLGVVEEDSIEDIQWLLQKIVNMRIFSDGEKMNLSLLDVNGELMIVSQFTLMAKTKKGNRPSFIKAARPDLANKLYSDFVNLARDLDIIKVHTGIFGEHMELDLVNNGPITIIIDSKNRDL